MTKKKRYNKNSENMDYSEIRRLIREEVYRAMYSFHRGDSRVGISEDIKRFLRKNTSKCEFHSEYAKPISSIPSDILKKACVNLKLVPTVKSYHDVLSYPQPITEAYGDLIEVDTAVKNLLLKYHLPEELAYHVEVFHNIYIYVITALVDENDKLIEEDMKKMGYYLSAVGPTENVDGVKYHTLQFEPTANLQDDVTDVIRTKYGHLYHWTPQYNIDSVLSKGLMPKSENGRFRYPDRIYLMWYGKNSIDALALGQDLCRFNRDHRNNGLYGLISVDVSKCGDDVHFYFDPNSEFGIYTETPIPSVAVGLVEVVDLSV